MKQAENPRLIDLVLQGGGSAAFTWIVSTAYRGNLRDISGHDERHERAR
jgi:hypothetical protein